MEQHHRHLHLPPPVLNSNCDVTPLSGLGIQAPSAGQVKRCQAPPSNTCTPPHAHQPAKHAKLARAVTRADLRRTRKGDGSGDTCSCWAEQVSVAAMMQ